MFSRGFYITLLVDIRHELAKNCVVLHDHCIYMYIIKHLTETTISGSSLWRGPYLSLQLEQQD